MRFIMILTYLDSKVYISFAHDLYAENPSARLINHGDSVSDIHTSFASKNNT